MCATTPATSFAGLRHFDWRIILRTRTLIYLAMWSAIGVGLTIALLARDRLEINVQHDRNPVAVTLADGSVRNGYTVKLLNMLPQPRTIGLALEGLPEATMTIADIDAPAARRFDIPVAPDQLRALRVFVAQPASALQADETSFRFVVTDPVAGETDGYSAIFETGN